MSSWRRYEKVVEGKRRKVTLQGQRCLTVQSTCGAVVGKEAFKLHLVHAVQELQEDWCEATALAAWTQVAPLAEFVAE